MIIHLVRHAHAGDRSAWTGNDSLRPLSPKGRAQSEAIADALAVDLVKLRSGDAGGAGAGSVKLVSSPFVRCTQTLEPLAERLALKVVELDRLGEGCGGRAALELLLDAARDASALVACSHGDVIPALVATAVGLGATIDGDLAPRKAARYMIEVDDGVVRHVTHIPRPEV